MIDDKFLENYNKLNPEQKEAVDTIEGPVLVIAGPGSGKTQLLSMRVANILKNTDALPSSILCLTFTESAANNMRERLIGMIGREAHKVAIHTFHSLGTEVINQNPEYFFFGAGYQPAEDLAQYRILRDIFRELKHDNPLNSYHQDHDFTFLKDAQSLIRGLKNGGFTPEEFADALQHNEQFLEAFNPLLQEFLQERVGLSTLVKLPEFINKINEINIAFSEASWTEVYPTLQNFVLRELNFVLLKIGEISEIKKKTVPLSEWKKTYTVLNAKNMLVYKDTPGIEKQKSLQEIYSRYQKELHKQRLFDYEDMLLEVVKAFEDEAKPELRYNYQERYQYILVDEFQDTNGVQIRLLDNLLNNEANSDFPNILAVGDDDQAVFKFQGASIQNILNFREKYPRSKIVTLNRNYRSTQDILDLATQVIEQNSERLANLEGVNKKLVGIDRNLV